MENLKKELLTELSQCTKCKFCLTSCPLYKGWIREGATGKLQAMYYALKYDLPLDNSLRDMIFACTTCSSCQKTCENYSTGVKSVLAIEKARRILVNKGIGPTPQEKKFANHIEREFNPYMELHVKRLDWLPRQERSFLPKRAEYLYFVGCTSSYRQIKIAQDSVNVLKRIGLDFTILQDEWCCGSPLLRTGQWDFVIKLAQHNISEIKKTGAHTVIFSCAGCYRAFNKDYTSDYHDFLKSDYDFKTLHMTGLLEDALRTKKLELKNSDKTITYHDPCHLGLHLSIYDTPRNVLKYLPGTRFVELPKNRENSVCCGAGGGYRASFPDSSIDVSVNRIKEAEEISADILASACPFCWRNLSDAVNNLKSKVQIKDIIELVAENIR